jgi:hypothetical protein
MLNPSLLNEGFAWWKFLRLTEKRDHAYMVSKWKPELVELCPPLFSWFENLPYISVRNVKLNYQTRPVASHVDFTNPSADTDLWDNNHKNEPCGYRVVISGSRRGSLMVERSTGAVVSCSLPDSTNTYVIDSTSGKHLVTNDSDRWTLYCHGEIDTVRHAAIIRRSLSIYSHAAIWDLKS